MSVPAAVLIAGERFTLSLERPFVFGRANREGVIGLDVNDMGISAEAGSIEHAWGMWWVVNRSRKRRLFLDEGGGGVHQRLECGHRHVINVARLNVLVPGAIYTHRLEVIVPTGELARFYAERPSGGTIPAAEARLSERELDVVVALMSGYLESFPRRQARPRSYQEAANLLGPPWTKTTVRKQVERLKQRLVRTGVYFEGPHANYDLADFLVENGLIGPDDLSRLSKGS